MLPALTAGQTSTTSRKDWREETLLLETLPPESLSREETTTVPLEDRREVVSSWAGAGGVLSWALI